MNHWLQGLLAVFFPERCIFCHRVIIPHTELCPLCRENEAAFRIQPPVCTLCGRSLRTCTCHKRKRHYERCVSAYVYVDLPRNGILRMKRHGKREAAVFFAKQMATVVRREYGNTRFAGIVPVPQSERTHRARGYHPTLWLAQALSEELCIPLADILIKVYDTKPQKGLPLHERSGNLLGAFDVRPDADVDGQRYLLVDDVITTGATLNECAKMLKIYGAIQTPAVTIAATTLYKINQDKTI